MHRNRVVKLDSHELDSSVLLLSDCVSLAEGQSESWETITRVVTFKDPYYGVVKITRAMLSKMVQNFKDDVYGQDIAVDIAHMASDGAAGFIRELSVERNRLRGRIEWTEFGIEAVTKKGFRYFSAEFNEAYENPETGDEHGCTLLGAALTTRPRVKRLDPIDPERLKLSFDGIDGNPPAIAPRMITILCEETAVMKEKFLKLLSAALKKIDGMKDELVTQLSETFGEALEGISDEAQANILLAAFTGMGTNLAKQLAETGHTGSIMLDMSPLRDAIASMKGSGPGLSKDDVLTLLQEQQQGEATKLAEQQKKRTANVKLLTDAIDAKEGFSDELKKELAESAQDLITAEMTPEQVTKLAENQIAFGNKIVAQGKLVSMGYNIPGAAGSVRISVDDSNTVRALQEQTDRRLGLLDMPESRRFAATGGKLLDENKAFADKVMAQYDSDHAVALREEHKMLSGGDGVVSDVSVPVSWERTVIREALYQMVGLQFVDVGTVAYASSYSIPYSYRDTTAAGRNSTRKYEGGSILRAGIVQTAETAYNLPQKLSFEVSDELRYLTAAGHIDFEAVAENQRNASRIIHEDNEQVIFNEVLQASDEYDVTAVADENLELQADDSDTIFVLANFPVVRPRAVYNLQGTQVGSTTNPVTVTYDSTELEEYDGTGTQDAGTYYVLDYNLGEIYLVDESGSVQTPADGTAYTISYSYTNNAYAFDVDLGTDAMDVHWDGFLYRYDLRKSIIEDDRYHMANFGLMSGSVMAQVEQAKKFGANSLRPGTDLSANGNLGRVKDVPNFKTRAPGLWMGDQRVIIGERGQTRFRMAKPWSLGELESQKDSNGRFTGKKEAYGDQFIVCHTPTQLKRAYTSIVLYSATGRVAR